MTERRIPQEKWIKASIIGTIWAASEIVIGSFLHNLKIPFSGNILTFIAIIILIPVSFRWKDKGLFWRAGVICALMKTMSPSAVIFGPMLAIMSEAFLLEISVRLLGRNVAGFVVGSVLAMSWNLFQKIINLVIFYGFNIVNLYTDVLKYAQKQLSISFDIVWLPILIMLLAYALFGLAAAVIGIRVGHKLETGFQPLTFPESGRKPMPGNSAEGNNFHYSIIWLIVNLMCIAGALFLLNATEWYVWMPAILLIAIVWIIRYKRAIRQLSKPKFWIYFVLITMVTAFVFGKMQGNSMLYGFMTGLQMNFRAILIILGFSVLGTELYNPVIRNFFMRTWFRQLPLALELSFESLPEMIACIPDFKTLRRDPEIVIKRVISMAEYRLEQITNSKSRLIFIVTGPVGSGKTTSLRQVVAVLRQNKVSCGGILTVREMEGDTTTGYFVSSISSGEKTPFLRMATGDANHTIGRFEIIDAGLEFGKRQLQPVYNSDKEIMIIDEIGRLELRNDGWAQPFQQLVESGKFHLLFSVRDVFCQNVIENWKLKNFTIFNASEKNGAEIARSVLEAIKK